MVKLIILGAGEGTRLRPLTQNCPKCMVNIFGKSLLEHQINTAKNCGIDEIIIVKGFLGYMIQIPNIRYYEINIMILQIWLKHSFVLKKN